MREPLSIQFKKWELCSDSTVHEGDRFGQAISIIRFETPFQPKFVRPVDKFIVMLERYPREWEDDNLIHDLVYVEFRDVTKVYL